MDPRLRRTNRNATTKQWQQKLQQQSKKQTNKQKTQKTKKLQQKTTTERWNISSATSNTTFLLGGIPPMECYSYRQTRALLLDSHQWSANRKWYIQCWLVPWCWGRRLSGHGWTCLQSQTRGLYHRRQKAPESRQECRSPGEECSVNTNTTIALQ